MATLKGGVLITKEEATGAVDGVNVLFATAVPYVPGTITVFLNGLQQSDPNDYTETTNQSFTFVQAPIGGADPDRIEVTYQRA